VPRHARKARHERQPLNTQHFSVGISSTVPTRTLVASSPKTLGVYTHQRRQSAGLLDFAAHHRTGTVEFAATMIDSYGTAALQIAIALRCC
jgi:hypothetical protein